TSASYSVLPERLSQFPSRSAFAFLTNQLNGASTPFASISRLWLAFRFCSFVLSEMAKLPGLLEKTLFDRPQNIGNCFAPRFGAEIAFAVNTNANGIGFHVALSDHEHGVDLHLFRALDFTIDLVAAFVDFGTDLMRAQFLQN